MIEAFESEVIEAVLAPMLEHHPDVAEWRPMLTGGVRVELADGRSFRLLVVPD